MSNRMERLEEFARLFARCPCCEEMDECPGDCTYATDALSDYEQMVIARDVLRELPSESVYGQWFSVADVPIPTDPDAWIVTARHYHEVDFNAKTEHLVTVCSKPWLAASMSTAVRKEAQVWMRIPPPPWLAKEGK